MHTREPEDDAPKRYWRCSSNHLSFPEKRMRPPHPFPRMAPSTEHHCMERPSEAQNQAIPNDNPDIVSFVLSFVLIRKTTEPAVEISNIESFMVQRRGEHKTRSTKIISSIDNTKAFEVMDCTRDGKLADRFRARALYNAQVGQLLAHAGGLHA